MKKVTLELIAPDDFTIEELSNILKRGMEDSTWETPEHKIRETMMELVSPFNEDHLTVILHEKIISIPTNHCDHETLIDKKCTECNMEFEVIQKDRK